MVVATSREVSSTTMTERTPRRVAISAARSSSVVSPDSIVIVTTPASCASSSMRATWKRLSPNSFAICTFERRST